MVETKTNGKPPGGMGTSTAPPPRVVRFIDLLGQFEQDAIAIHDARVNGTLRGPQTGLRELDDVLGGVLQPGTHVVQGNSGTGKTAYALQIAAECGFPSTFVSTEMHLLELMKRHTARVTGTHLHALKDGSLAPADAVKRATVAAQAAPFLTLVDATQGHVSVELIREFARVAREKGKARHVLVVLDSLHTWSAGAPLDGTEYEKLNWGCDAIRRLTADLNCPALVTSERNRANIVGGGLNSGAGSRRIEYGAESLIGLDVDTDKSLPPAPLYQKWMKITVEKNRNGGAGMALKAVFHGAYQKFTERER